MNVIDRIFNWKKYPDGIFFLVVPLVLIGFGSQTALAYLYWKEKQTLIPAFIVLAGFVVLVFALYHMKKTYSRFKQTEKENAQ